MVNNQETKRVLLKIHFMFLQLHGCFFYKEHQWVLDGNLWHAGNW